MNCSFFTVIIIFFCVNALYITGNTCKCHSGFMIMQNCVSTSDLPDSVIVDIFRYLHVRDLLHLTR